MTSTTVSSSTGVLSSGLWSSRPYRSLSLASQPRTVSGRLRSSSTIPVDDLGLLPLDARQHHVPLIVLEALTYFSGAAQAPLGRRHGRGTGDKEPTQRAAGPHVAAAAGVHVAGVVLIQCTGPELRDLPKVPPRRDNGINPEPANEKLKTNGCLFRETARVAFDCSVL